MTYPVCKERHVLSIQVVTCNPQVVCRLFSKIFQQTRFNLKDTNMNYTFAYESLKHHHTPRNVFALKLDEERSLELISIHY